MLKASVEQFLVNARIVINNVLDNKKVIDIITAYGYNLSEIENGRKLYDNAHQLYLLHEENYGKQIEDEDELSEIWEVAFASYIKNIRITRVLVKKDDYYNHKIKLNSFWKKSITGLIEQAKLFYDNVLEDKIILQRLGNININTDKINQDRDLIIKTEEVIKNMAQNEGENYYQSITKRDQAIDELSDWMSEFVSIAKIALEDKTELLKQIGILLIR
jgi:hypothetical protein